MSSINLSPLTAALSQVKASVADAAGQRTGRTPKTLWISAYSTSGTGADPGFVRWSPKPELVEKMCRLARMCQEEGIQQIALSEGPDGWGADPAEMFSYEASAGLSDAQLFVNSTGFWFRDKPKHDDPIETRMVTFEELSDALTGSKDHVLFDNQQHQVSLEQTILDSGDASFPYRAICLHCGEAFVREDGDAFCSSDCETASNSDTD